MRYFSRFVVVMLSAAMTGLAGPAAANSPAGPAEEPLVDAVAREMPGRGGDQQVNVLREDQATGWAFGAAVTPASESHAYPEGWLWVARDTGAGWEVALEGSPRFVDLSRQAPVLAPAERERFDSWHGPSGPQTSEPGGADLRTGMRLPYAVDQAWRLTGGPHPMSGSARSSIDLAGGDGRVLAAQEGTAYVMCDSGTGWLRVVHDRGFSTDYYHLRGNISAEGTEVSEGEFLGYIGTDVSCGGTVTGPHLHFSLRRDGEYVPIDGYAFGGWTIRAGAEPYQGYARHGSTRVDVGGQLPNHGALELTDGVVDTNGGGVLNQRSGPGTDHDIVGTLPDGEIVAVVCAERGTTHIGRDGRSSDRWHQLTDDSWVSDAYLWTGTGDPVAGWC